MRRDELKDGEWYLIKVKDRYLSLRMVNGDLQGANEIQYGKTTIEHLIECEGEWTKIKPECFFYDNSMTDNWIKCSDKMPEYGQEIIVLMADRTVTSAIRYWQIEGDLSWEKSLWSTIREDNICGNMVVKWQPLPP